MVDRVSKKVVSVHITILVCLLTLDDNFHFFDDFTDSRGFVSLFKNIFIEKFRFTNILQLFSLQFLHFRLSHRLFTNCIFSVEGMFLSGRSSVLAMKTARDRVLFPCFNDNI